MRSIPVPELSRLLSANITAISRPVLIHDQRGIAGAVVCGLEYYRRLLNALDDRRDLSSPQMQSAVARASRAQRDRQVARERGDLIPLLDVVNEVLHIRAMPPQPPGSPYEVDLDPIAKAQLDSLPETHCRLVLMTLKALELDPRSERVECDLMVGAIRLWRLHINGYRILYHISDQAVIVVGITLASWDISGSETFGEQEQEEAAESKSNRTQPESADE